MGSHSIPVVPGNPTLASEGNNIRLDALALALDCTAGEAYSATFTKGGITLPTLLYQGTGGKWFKARSNGTSLSAGYAQIVGLAYNSSAGDGSAVKVIMPGAYVTGSGLTIGMNLWPSDDEAGAMETYDQANMVAYKLIGSAVSTTDFYFFPTSNTSLPMELRSYFVSGEAITLGDLCYVKQSDGRVYKAIATSSEAGFARQLVVAVNTTGGAGNTILCAKLCSTTLINGTYTAGLVYVGSVAGQISNTRGGTYNRCIGVALSASSVYLMPLEPESHDIIERVVAFENWSAGDLLYKRQSDGRYGRTDSDIAESGICEHPAIAAATHTGGNGSTQLVYMPGSVLKGVITGTATQRVWPSPTPGARVTTRPALTVFFRKFGHFIGTDIFDFTPGEVEFLPTGMQEIGMTGAAWQIDESITSPNDRFPFSINFNKTMVNTPASITLSSTFTQRGTPTATISSISRFGAVGYCQNGGFLGAAATTVWAGTYTTVGN